jgi:Flp pilus assembly protein TadD/transglutaminase-like putative cysteine protease
MAMPSWFSNLLVITSVVLSAGAARATPQRRAARAESPAKTVEDTRYANEPYVFERHDLTVRFKNDGTEERELAARVRIESDAGAQQFRQLAFRYISPDEQASIRSLKIGKRDGSSVDVLGAPNRVKESASATTRDFPAYATFLKELRVEVPSLQPGETLDYDVVVRDVKPIAPGEFWFEYDFPRDAIILDDRLELNLPQGRTFRIKAPGFSNMGGRENPGAAKADGGGFVFTRAEQGGRTILRWKHVNLKIAAGEKQPSMSDAGKAAPDVQVTSLKDWAAVAQWYAERERASAQVTPPIRSKTQELMHGAASEQEKAQAICTYVSQRIRDVDFRLDFGQLPTRSAESVLASGYGDSEGKNALLTAMLEVAGIRSSAALIPYRRKLDAQFPSPAQFDQVIEAVSDGEKLVWVDPSAPVAPFGFLPPPLRGKSALLIDTAGQGRIVETPPDPPFLSAQKVEIDARISELGKLTGTVRYSLRGDTEYVLRTAFHRAPQGQWNQLGQTILALDGLHGQATSVSTSDPLETAKPFQVMIGFSDPAAFAWPMEHAKIALPLLNIAMPDAPAKRGEPVVLGTPLDVETDLRLRFPSAFMVNPPVGIAVSRDYADFKSSYRFEKGELLAERALNFKMRELPASRTTDYLAFAHAVQADEEQALLVENPAGKKAEIPPNAAADDLFDAGAAALKSGNTRGAIPLLERVTQLQPAHKQAWNDLGLAYMQAQRFQEAAGAFQKQVQENPSDDRAHDYLGVALEELHRDDEAADAFRKQIELEPLDAVAHAQLGNIFLTQRRYERAVPELGKATVLSPDNAQLEILLGRAYLNLGDKDRARAAFQKGMQLSPSPQIRNEVAYSLAEHASDLDEAQQYAEAAIRATAAKLDKAELAQVSAADFAETSNMGAYWDTLGWVYFRKGDLVSAKRYLRAAWLLTENGEAGDHLAQLYEKSGEKERAIHQCALALAGSQPVEDTRARLMLLLGGNAQVEEMVSRARPELETMRTFAVQLPAHKNASADFLIAIVPGGKTSLSARVEQIRFVGGEESLRRFANELKAIDYGEIFPDATPVKLMRRGTLSCSAAGQCSFTLGLPEDAPSAR